MPSDHPERKVQGRLLGIARKAASGAPMEIMGSTEVSVENGIRGDYRGRSTRRQITILSNEAWQAACDELESDLLWTTRRANLLVEGLALADTKGQSIQIGDLILRITGETTPCGLMDDSFSGLRERLVPNWRGGVTCQVLQGGTIKVGDPIHFTGEN